MSPAGTAARDRGDRHWLRRLPAILGIVGFSLAGGALLLFRLGYGFETNDQVQYLLLPYRSIYQDFLIGDWLTWETSHYHVTFSWLIRGLHLVLGERLPEGVFALHLVTLVGVSYALIALTRACGFGWFGALLALLVTALIREEAIAGALVNHGVLLPADMALPAFLIGLAGWIRGQHFRAGLWLGLAGLLHVNYAVVGPAVVAGPEIWNLVRERDWRRALRIAGGFLLICWPALLMLLRGFLAADAAPEALEILYKVRSPHHYDPELLNSGDPWWIGALLVAGLSFWAAPSATPEGRRLRAATAALVGLQVVAAVATWLGLHAVVRMFLWRLSAPLALIAQLVAGEALVRAIRERRPVAVLCTVAALVVVAAYATDGTVRVVPRVDLRGYGVLLPLLIPLGAAAAVAARRPPRRALGWAAAGVAGLVLASCVAFSVPGLLLAERRAVRWPGTLERITRITAPRIAPRRLGRNARLYRWIRRNAPPDAVFMIPPGMLDFRLGARRGIYVDWKGCPMKGEELVEWRRRLFAVMGTAQFPAVGWKLSGVAQRRFLGQPLGRLAGLARQEGIGYLLARRADEERARSAGLRPRFTHGNLSVYEVLPGARAPAPDPPPAQR